MTNWRNILSYKTEPLKFEVGARVMVDGTKFELDYGRPFIRIGFRVGEIGTIHSRCDTIRKAWYVLMDSGKVDHKTGEAPAFYERDLKLI